MRYILIGNDGEFQVKDADWQHIRAEVGPPGPAPVNITPVWSWGLDMDMRGWVNDTGHAQPDTCPRNIIGTLVLTGLGAALMPYAGPIVITGWAPRRLDGLEIRELTGQQIDTIREVYTLSRRALDGEEGDTFAMARAIAETARTAETPTLRIIPGDPFGRLR